MGQADVGIAGRVKWIFVVFFLIDQFNHFCCYHHLQDEYSMFSSEYVEVVLS